MFRIPDETPDSKRSGRLTFTSARNDSMPHNNSNASGCPWAIAAEQEMPLLLRKEQRSARKIPASSSLNKGFSLCLHMPLHPQLQLPLHHTLQPHVSNSRNTSSAEFGPQSAFEMIAADSRRCPGLRPRARARAAPAQPSRHCPCFLVHRRESCCEYFHSAWNNVYTGNLGRSIARPSTSST